MLVAAANSTLREDWIPLGGFRSLPGGLKDSVLGCTCGFTGVIPGINSPWYVARPTSI